MPPSTSSSLPYRSHLDQPVLGLEAEFRVFVDDEEVAPEALWRTPQHFVRERLLPRSNKSSQLPTGGAVYFDGGVIEVVTPVIELAPQCTARVVRSLWEQITFVRAALDEWESDSGRKVRLEAFSCHVNVSFELTSEERNRNRTVQKLAVLLATLLPLPVILLGANRRSTGIGVRPRRDRIEITMDFTPDPGLMAATVALIAGVARGVIAWPSYRLDEIERRGIAVPAGLEPSKHPTRNGWVARAESFPVDPFSTDPDGAIWTTRAGEAISMREIAKRTALTFQDEIRAVADPFSIRLLYSILRGDTASLVDLDDRPAEYLDIGRATAWGTVLGSLDQYRGLLDHDGDALRRRREDVELLAPPWRGESTDRRDETRDDDADRRAGSSDEAAPILGRSEYESVFIRASRGDTLRIGDEVLTPVRVHGWYHVEFESESGERCRLSIDQIRTHARWSE
jgi:hypothetical protein